MWRETIYNKWDLCALTMSTPSRPARRAKHTAPERLLAGPRAMTSRTCGTQHPRDEREWFIRPKGMLGWEGVRVSNPLSYSARAYLPPIDVDGSDRALRAHAHAAPAKHLPPDKLVIRGAHLPERKRRVCKRHHVQNRLQ